MTDTTNDLDGSATNPPDTPVETPPTADADAAQSAPAPDLPEPIVLQKALPVTWVVTPPAPGEVITSGATSISYTMGARIGEGNFGVVYGCEDIWNNSLAAKVMKPHGTPEKVRAATVAELNKLLHLRHPHITFVFDAFEYRDTFYLITERCFCPLTELMAIQDFNGLLWIRAIARCLLQAVNYAHLNGYAHQDIHLGNVFAAFAKNEMNADDPGAIQFKLGDLGVAKLFNEIDASNTRNQLMLPPEVLDPSEFGPLGYRIDLYHCGLLFLHLAHGRELPFTADEIKAGAPRQLALQLPAPFNFALGKALRRHVAARTENAMEFWRDLNSGTETPKPAEQLELEPLPALPATEASGG